MVRVATCGISHVCLRCRLPMRTEISSMQGSALRPMSARVLRRPLLEEERTALWGDSAGGISLEKLYELAHSCQELDAEDQEAFQALIHALILQKMATRMLSPHAGSIHMFLDRLGKTVDGFRRCLR